ncbi:P-loop containing nucleoside triphosphate hydrolase protein [Atractiella rhizophila]|nr:P-loop containing nucleoside triphosphate hydrolase protein [Atractiella rhizophila]
MGLTKSTKVELAMRLLKKFQSEGEANGKVYKTIIFSQFTQMLEILQPFLEAADIGFTRLDGKMKREQREVALDAFKTDPSTVVLLASLKCGSVGLNLTAACRVILFDLWWNPAIEEQAFDRVHRIGQTEKVQVYKLVVESTVEERILELQEKKREIASAALSGEGAAKLNKLSTQDILFLLSLLPLLVSLEN